MPASSNGQVHGAAATTVTGTLTSGRVTLSNGAHSVTDSADFTFDPGGEPAFGGSVYLTPGLKASDAYPAALFVNATAAGIADGSSSPGFQAGQISATIQDAIADLLGLVISTAALADLSGSQVGLLIQTIVSGGGVTVPTAIGLQVGDVSGATHNRAISTGTGDIVFGGIQSFADNAAAVTGGLAVGSLYRTGDVLKIVH